MLFISHMMLYKICMWLTYYPIAILLDIVRICIGQRPRYVCMCTYIAKTYMNILLFIFAHLKIDTKFKTICKI
jgi:hypothetical protein